MTVDDLFYAELVDVGRRIQARQLSSVEVTEAVLKRIAGLDGRLKSYATLTADLAIAQARQADAEIMHGTIRGPLHGVPVAVKDLYIRREFEPRPACQFTRTTDPIETQQSSRGCVKPVPSSWANCN